MKKSLLFAMALGLAFSACSKEDVPLYDTENANFIEFVGASEDTTAFSFMFHPEVAAGGTYDLAIPVKILGLAKDKDRTYTVTVVDTLKTTDGEAAGTSTFQIGSENTSIELGAEGNKININLVWGEF